MKKVILYLFLLIVLLLTSTGVWAYFEFLYTKPLNKAELAELTPDWEVVTHGNWSPWFIEADGTKTWNPAASFNGWLATVPEEDKAWPVMIRAKEKNAYFLNNNNHLGTRPNHAERWDRLKGTLASTQSDDLLAELKIAFAKPFLGHVLTENTGPYEHAAILEFNEDFDPGILEFDPLENTNLMAVNLGSIGVHKYCTNFVESKAAYELEQGNVDEFVEIVLLLNQSTELCVEFPTLIGQLVQVSIEHVCMELIDWSIQYHSEQLTDAHLAQFDKAVAQIQDFDVNWQGEALFLHDTFRRQSNSRGALLMGTGLGLPVSLTDSELHPSMQRALLVINNMLKGLHNISQIPWDSTIAGPEEIFESQGQSSNVFGDLLLDILATGTNRMSVSFLQTKQQAIGLRAGIAAHRHRLRHGEFPSSLDSIDSDLLTIHPIDALTGNPLHYMLTENGPVIYSVGDDRIDNHGEQLWKSKIKEKLGSDGIVFDVEVLSVLPPRWISPEKAARMFGEGSKRDQGDWVLFPASEDDPWPLEFTWGENDEYILVDDIVDD